MPGRYPSDMLICGQCGMSGSVSCLNLDNQADLELARARSFAVIVQRQFLRCRFSSRVSLSMLAQMLWK